MCKDVKFIYLKLCACLVVLFIVSGVAGLCRAGDWKVSGFTPEMSETPQKAFIPLEDTSQEFTVTPVTAGKNPGQLKWKMPNETFKESPKNWIGSETEEQTEESFDMNMKKYFMDLIAKNMPAGVTPKAKDK